MDEWSDGRKKQEWRTSGAGEAIGMGKLKIKLKKIEIPRHAQFNLTLIVQSCFSGALASNANKKNQHFFTSSEAICFILRERIIGSDDAQSTLVCCVLGKKVLFSLSWREHIPEGSERSEAVFAFRDALPV